MGKTQTAPQRQSKHSKHPHVHGEDELQEISVMRLLETPPRAWGRPSVNICSRREAGNTPTCMGKTILAATAGKYAWKHPHVHGEDTVASSATVSWKETPPRAWGRLCGNSNDGVASVKHPHVHGEDNVYRIVIGHNQETPPRAWGRHPLRD